MGANSAGIRAANAVTVASDLYKLSKNESRRLLWKLNFKEALYFREHRPIFMNHFYDTRSRCVSVGYPLVWFF